LTNCPRPLPRPALESRSGAASGSFLFSFNGRAVRRVTGVASQSAGMLLRLHLRKMFWLGGIRFVATHAQLRDIRPSGLNLHRIVRVLRLRSVARLAVHSRVLALALYFQHILVTRFAGVMPSEGNRLRTNLRQ